MKKVASLKKRDKSCYIVKRRRKVVKNGKVKIKPVYYVYSKTNRRFNQKQA